MEGYTAEGKYIGSAYEMEEEDAYSSLSIQTTDRDILAVHAPVLHTRQLVQNDYTNDTAAGGTDSGGQQAVLHMPPQVRPDGFGEEHEQKQVERG